MQLPLPLLSTELLMEAEMSFYYYIFYRNLFLHISSPWQFAAIKAVHVAGELTAYLLRLTRWYYECSTAVMDAVRVEERWWLWFARDRSPYAVWCVAHFIA